MAGGMRREEMLLLLIFVLVALLYLAVPTILGERKAAPTMKRGEAKWSNSETTIQHLAPTSWTSDDVGTWLDSIDLGALRPTFKRNGVNGAVLLEMSNQSIRKDLAIDNDLMAKRLENEIKVLKHRVSMAHRWGADKRARADKDKAPTRTGAGEALPEVKIYRVGESMFTDKDGSRVEEGVEPAITLHKAPFLKLRDLISLATEELGRPVREFVAHNGDLVTSMQELPNHV